MVNIEKLKKQNEINLVKRNYNIILMIVFIINALLMFKYKTTIYQLGTLVSGCVYFYLFFDFKGY
ncbi:MAG: hypothetical protein ACOCRK_02700 [bacterium]